MSEQEKRETIAAVIAGMRERKSQLEDAIFNAPLCYSTDDMRTKVEILDEFIDRLEAAHRRELAAGGNAAKLREALKYVLQFDATDEAAEEDGLTDAERITEYADHIEECQKKARAALSAPPRNCDKYSHDEALNVWAAENENERNGCFDEWLYHTATETERKGEGEE